MRLTNFESLTDSVNSIKDLVALDTKILNANNKDLLDQSDHAFVYAWQFKQLGGFDKRLSKAIAHADGSNLIRLYKGFPREVLAMRSFNIKNGYWDLVLDQHDQ